MLLTALQNSPGYYECFTWNKTKNVLHGTRQGMFYMEQNKECFTWNKTTKAQLD